MPMRLLHVACLLAAAAANEPLYSFSDESPLVQLDDSKYAPARTTRLTPLTASSHSDGSHSSFWLSQL